MRKRKNSASFWFKKAYFHFSFSLLKDLTMQNSAGLLLDFSPSFFAARGRFLLAYSPGGKEQSSPDCPHNKEEGFFARIPSPVPALELLTCDRANPLFPLAFLPVPFPYRLPPRPFLPTWKQQLSTPFSPPPLCYSSPLPVLFIANVTLLPSRKKRAFLRAFLRRGGRGRLLFLPRLYTYISTTPPALLLPRSVYLFGKA